MVITSYLVNVTCLPLAVFALRAHRSPLRSAPFRVQATLVVLALYSHLWYDLYPSLSALSLILALENFSKKSRASLSIIDRSHTPSRLTSPFRSHSSPARENGE